MRAADKDAAQGAARGLEEGVYRLIPLARWTLRTSQELLSRADPTQSLGVVRVPKGTIPSQQALIMALPKVWRSDAILRQRLPNPPSNLQRTSLGAAETIGMEPTGVIEGLKSSGLSRFYRANDVGIVAFNEENFRVPGGVIEACGGTEHRYQRHPGRSRWRLMAVGAAGQRWSGLGKTRSTP